VTPADQGSQTITFVQPPDATVGVPVTLSAFASSGLPVSFRSDTPAVCRDSGTTVTTTAPGTCTVTASQGGNTDYAPAPDVARSFQVVAGKKAQTITFSQPPQATVGVPVTLSASASSGLPVSFRSGTPAVCAVSGTTVTTTAPGTCTITASQGGNTDYAPAADVQRSFQVLAGQKTQTITFTHRKAARLGVPVTLSAFASSGLPVSFRSDTPAVCRVSGTIVTTTAASTCTITASQGGNSDYAPAADVKRSFRVHAGHKKQTITFTPPRAARLGVPVTLSAFASSGLPVSFRSETPAVCRVSGTTVTTTAAGTCTVTASQGGNTDYAPAPDVRHSLDINPVALRLTGATAILLGAALLAAAGASLVLHHRRRRPRPPSGPVPTVRAVPDAGPPGQVSVRNTGTASTHTVRIEPSPGAGITTIKEARP
jgi:hypothetical protein